MELRSTAVLLVGLAAVLGARTTSDPQMISDATLEARAELSALEDRLARDPADSGAAVALADAYLDAGLPGLAVAAVTGADEVVLTHPAAAHRLALAYEASGRLDDAIATATLAEARCARALGATRFEPTTPVPSASCTASQHAMLDAHRGALTQMKRWGVVDPTQDRRARLAYDVAMRRARIALSGW
jgi:hypothetical protein